MPLFILGDAVCPDGACNGALVMALILYTSDHCDSFISSRISAVCWEMRIKLGTTQTATLDAASAGL